METISRVGFITNCTDSPFRIRRLSPIPLRQILLTKKGVSISASRTSSRPVAEVEEDDVLRTFLKDRAVNGDFISKASDLLWRKEVVKSIEDNASVENFQEADQVMQSEYNAGFLKLLSTREWISGEENSPPPLNKKPTAKELQDDRERRKKLNLLQYEALKRELMFLSIGIGIACSGYCIIALSLQAAVSYGIGVLFSCLYLQLLFRHVDNLSKEMVPPIFTPKKRRQEEFSDEEIDLKEVFEKVISGTGLALSSPRLVIPAAIYGFWILSHKYFSNDFFDFQLTPAMVGLFAYKAAALVQVYRDNDDVQFIFPQGEE